MIPCEKIMTRNPVCVHEDDLVTNARALIRKHKFRTIPVVADDGLLIGVISRRDVLQITSTRTNLMVKAVMNSTPYYALPDDDVFVIAKKIVESGMRQVPVVESDAHRKVIGIVSAKDVLKTILSPLNDIRPHKGKNNVENIMITDVITCAPDDELSKVWPKMYGTGITGLPVVKQKKNKSGVLIRNEIVGVITYMDIIRNGAFRLSRESGRVKSSAVEKIMKKPPITIAADKNTVDAAELMLKYNVARLPVVDSEDGLVGIIAIEDVLMAYVG